ncbi:hypothetical protein F4779DRAFT_573006 [Xylariaceae sp. FL0662B]|nr:hypothetical protein F4779DRAFT_573006 [Xylariaceae sp. FL0662B]
MLKYKCRRGRPLGCGFSISTIHIMDTYTVQWCLLNLSFYRQSGQDTLEGRPGRMIHHETLEHHRPPTTAHLLLPLSPPLSALCHTIASDSTLPGTLERQILDRPAVLPVWDSKIFHPFPPLFSSCLVVRAWSAVHNIYYISVYVHTHTYRIHLTALNRLKWPAEWVQRFDESDEKRRHHCLLSLFYLRLKWADAILTDHGEIHDHIETIRSAGYSRPHILTCTCISSILCAGSQQLATVTYTPVCMYIY